MKKRTYETMIDLILSVARKDDRIRAVVMNGSRVNPKVVPDRFADYDVIYYVTGLPSFTADHSWVDVFGERLIMQMPEDKVLPPPDRNGRFPYLMQFADGNRIDLTLATADAVPAPGETDSLSAVLLDKDGLIGELPPPSDADYRVKKPSAKEFADVENEFWWVSLYTAKGLGRGETLYAKGTLEGPVRTAFMRMLRWYAGLRTDWTANTGSFDKWLPHFIEEELYERVLRTYPDAEPDHIWSALLTMADLFRDVAGSVGRELGYPAAPEAESVRRELNSQKKEQEEVTVNGERPS
ncbi:aminoglycoside 6-adenylyltransferase [Alteribacter natronophilus]|uniref:aminoglycoside 6-adenylyltransferase n=1 Tax=Alteribacter natronophilus TaxID=2583810 RepID=UPI00148607F6|nr:aminoglycoside 6-adenylyltransferase [Alteribacter natronophilus]